MIWKESKAQIQKNFHKILSESGKVFHTRENKLLIYAYISVYKKECFTHQFLHEKGVSHISHRVFHSIIFAEKMTKCMES